MEMVRPIPAATFRRLDPSRVLANALELRPMCSDPAARTPTMDRLLPRRNLGCVLVASSPPDHGMPLPLLPALLLRQRGRGHEEVNPPALELRLRRHDQDPAPGASGARPGQHVVGVGRQDLPGGDAAAVLLDVAAEVDDADDVERPAREDASQATPQAVP
ncbi:hypothetical protein MUK42_19595, partial [Musa troglodytarum]